MSYIVTSVSLEQVANLETKILKTDEEIKSLVAKGSSNPTAKAKALQVAPGGCIAMFSGHEEEEDVRAAESWKLRSLKRSLFDALMIWMLADS